MAQNLVTSVAEQVLSSGGAPTARVSSVAEQVLSSGAHPVARVTSAALMVLSDATVPPTGVTGTFNTTETKDTLAATGYPGTTVGVLAATETKDTFAGTGSTVLSGVLAATEVKDAFAGTGVVPPVGTIAASEQKDSWSTSSGFELPGIERSGVVGSPFNLTTNGPDRIIVLMVAQDGASTTGTVDSVTGAGLTFRQRQVAQGNVPNGGAFNGMSLEVWWAYAPLKLTGEGISVNFGGTTNTRIVAYAVVKGMNGNYADPWSRVELPSGGSFGNPIDTSPDSEIARIPKIVPLRHRPGQSQRGPVHEHRVGVHDERRAGL
jgi:hypothetical protein